MELTDELERRLARLRETRPELDPGAIALQGNLIRARLAMLEPELAPLRLRAEVALQRLQSHIPLLHQAPVFVDVGWAAGLFGRLVEVSPQAADVQAALDEGLLDTESLFHEAFVGHRDHIALIAADADVDADQVSSLAWLAVAPMLTGYARQLQPHLDRGLPAWDRGYCPVCGAWPGFIELRRHWSGDSPGEWSEPAARGVQPTRWLRCLSCGTAWPAPPNCTYCQAEAPLTLGLDDDPRYALEACDRCQGYLKTIRAFEPAPTELLPLDDLASVHLDALAQAKGYARPTAPGFPIELSGDVFPVHQL